MKRIAILALLSLIGCTSQERARSFGGSSSMTLPAGAKLVTATWKNADLWVLTRPMRADEKAETYQFQESSSWGIAEGTVTIKEAR